LSDLASDRGGLGLRFCAGFGQDRHDLCTGLQRIPSSYRLLYALDVFMRSPIDLVKILP